METDNLRRRGGNTQTIYKGSNKTSELSNTSDTHKGRAGNQSGGKLDKTWGMTNDNSYQNKTGNTREHEQQI